MHFGSFPPSSMVIFVVILGLSFVVARLDFVRRHGRPHTAVRRIPVGSKTSASGPSSEQPNAGIVEPESKVITDPQAKIIAEPYVKIIVEPMKININPQAKVVADPPPVKQLDLITRLPGVDRALATKLTHAHVVPMPMPAPKSPTYAWRRITVTCWPQES